MFNIDKVHFILDEMVPYYPCYRRPLTLQVMNGCIIETNRANVLAALQLLDGP